MYDNEGVGFIMTLYVNTLHHFSSSSSAWLNCDCRTENASKWHLWYSERSLGYVQGSKWIVNQIKINKKNERSFAIF